MIVDTNILIAIEDNARGGHVNGQAAAEFSALAAKHGFTLVVADGTRQDFLRATPAVRANRLAQLQRHHVLARVSASRNQRSRFRVPATAGANDQCDLEILCALDNNAADLLVSEDRRLRRRAARAGLSDRVLSLADALAYLRALEGRPQLLPSVDKVTAYQIPRDAEILDSVAADYPGFDEWWAKVQAEGRDVLVVGQPHEPDAICVLKVEANAPSNRAAVPKSLKLCTFKVADGAPGKKFGELLLKAAVDEARGLGLRAIFVTVTPEKAEMLAFLERFGFAQVPGATTDLEGEIVLEKLLEPEGADLDPLIHAIAYGPGSARADRVHIVPMQPRYVVELLPETIADVGLDFPLPTKACGNAIRKAYLSNSPSRKVAPGDLLAFYRSHLDRGIVATGVVESTLVSSDVAALLDFVGTRTVYTPTEVQELATGGEVLAVLFRFDRVVSPPMTIFELLSEGVLRAAPQSFAQVPTQKVGLMCQRLLT